MSQLATGVEHGYPHNKLHLSRAEWLYFLSLDNIRLRLKQNNQPLDIQVKGVAFPSDLISFFLEQLSAEQHGIFTIKMIRG